MARRKYKKRSLAMILRDQQDRVITMCRIPKPTGIFEALKELPLGTENSDLIGKAELAISDLMGSSGGLSQKQAHDFLRHTLQPAPLLSAIKVLKFEGK